MLEEIKKQPATSTVDVCPITDLRRSDGTHLILGGLIPYVKNNVRYRVGWMDDGTMSPVAVREIEVVGTLYKIIGFGDGRSRYLEPDNICGMKPRILQYDPTAKRVYGIIPDEHRESVGTVVVPPKRPQ